MKKPTVEPIKSITTNCQNMDGTEKDVTTYYLPLGQYIKVHLPLIKSMNDEIKVNEKLKVTFLPAVHWSKRSLTDTNKTLWGNFLIQYDGKKILFACDTGIGDIYKSIGQKYGPIDLTFINIGAYNFYPIMPYKDKSIYHTNPEEALEIAQNLKSKKVVGMHWGTFVLSLEPIMEPPKRFKASANKYGFKKEDVLIYKIGEFDSLKKLLSYN